MLALGLCCFTLLSLRMPIASEIRYFESAREMVESGDWTVPTLGYVPYFEKPILLYWVSAASQALFGSSTIAARLPSILSATLSLLVTWAVARRLLGEKGGMQAALVVLVSGYFFVLGSVLTTDALFAALLWSAWYAWWRARTSRGSGWTWTYCAATALAFMTKGPLALILVGGSIATYEIFRQPTSARWYVRVVRGARAALVSGRPLRLVLVTLALNLPWSLAVLRRDGRFLEFFYVRENFQAFFDGSVHHKQNPFFYAGILLMAFAPWSIPCALTIAVVLRERVLEAWRGVPARTVTGERDDLRGYLGAIVIFTLAFLEASSAKLASYPLPILPALGILIVDAWRARVAAPPPWLRWSQLLGAAASIAGVLVYLSSRKERASEIPQELIQHLSIGMLVTGLALLGAGVLAVRGRFWSGIALSGAALAGLVVVTTARLEELGIARNLQPLASAIAAREQQGDRVVTTTQYAQDYTLQLTLHQRIGLLGGARELGMGHFAEVTAPSVPIPREPYLVSGENLPGNPWLYTRARLAQELRSPRRMWFVGTRKDLDDLRADGVKLRVVESSREAILCTNVD